MYSQPYGGMGMGMGGSPMMGLPNQRNLPLRQQHQMQRQHMSQMQLQQQQQQHQRMLQMVNQQAMQQPPPHPSTQQQVTRIPNPKRAAAGPLQRSQTETFTCTSAKNPLRRTLASTSTQQKENNNDEDIQDPVDPLAELDFNGGGNSCEPRAAGLCAQPSATFNPSAFQQQQVQPQQPPADPAQEMQKKTFWAQASLQIGVQLIQVLLHVARSGHELFSIGLGSYYAAQGMKALLGGHNPLGQMGVGQPAPWDNNAGLNAAKHTPQGRLPRLPTVPKASSKTNWQSTVLAFAAFAVAAVAVESLFRRWKEGKEQRRYQAELAYFHERQQRLQITAGPSDSLQETNQPAVEATSPPQIQATFVAAFDFNATEPGQLSIRKGEHLKIGDYDPDRWCTAVRTLAHTATSDAGECQDGAKDGYLVAEGLVPGNFVRPLPTTKF